MKLLSRFTRVILLEEFQDDCAVGVTFRVTDYKNLLMPWQNTRRIEFVRDLPYAYSSSYLNRYRHYQPIYHIVQRLADCFFRTGTAPENALVLGCAGCSIPRFLALHYRGCSITGIEYSAKMIEIARKYFTRDPIFQRLRLIHADAFSYVKEEKGTFQFLYVDVFQAEKNHPRVQETEFFQDLAALADGESITIVNLLSFTREECGVLIRRMRNLYDAAYVFDEKFHNYAVFVRTGEPSLLPAFEARAAKVAKQDDKVLPSGFR